MDKITRDIHIDLILEKFNPIIDKFNELWKGMVIIEENIYHKSGGEFMYYNSKKEWIFFRDDDKDPFWCNYDRYWKVFETEFKLNYGEIQSITKILVENALDNKLTKPLEVTGINHSL